MGWGRAPSGRRASQMALWDRTGSCCCSPSPFFVWSEYSDANPFNTFGDALAETVGSKRPLFVLAGIELVRQLHYLVSGRWSRYQLVRSVFGPFGAAGADDQMPLPPGAEVHRVPGRSERGAGRTLRRYAGDNASGAALGFGTAMLACRRCSSC